MERFVAIDVEVANPRYHSICQIGVVLFEGGQEVAAERVFVNPLEEFGVWQTRIHGIKAEHVATEPHFGDRYQWLRDWADGATLVSHSSFDRAAIGQACERHGRPALGCTWVDSIGMAMAAWPGLQSYRLPFLANEFGIAYRAHDALDDARTCGRIVQRAIAMGIPLRDRSVTSSKSAGARYRKEDVRRTGDGSGGLLGETIVFTGELSIAREVAANMAAEAGADVIPNVTKKLTMLVVGERDLQPGWQAKSGKHRKAEELIEKGHDIRIVSEPDFVVMAAIKD